MTESDAREGFVPETLYSANYRGRIITVETAIQKGFSGDRGYLKGLIDGQRATFQYNVSGDVVDRIVKRLRHVVDIQHADSVVRPLAQSAVGTFAYVEGVPTVKNPKIGDPVCGSAFGRMRRGIVEKVKRTGTVVVAYVTPSSPGEVRRMTLKPGEIFDPNYMRQIG